MNLETLRRLSGINAKKEAKKTKSSLTERNELRKLAGLTLLSEEDVTVDDASADPADLDPAAEEIPSGDDLTTPNETGSEDEDALVKSLKHIANHAEGKVGQDLLDIIRQVYDAGVQDGKAQAEEESTPAEETPEEDGAETSEETPDETSEETPDETTDAPESSEEDKEDKEGAKVEESVLVEGPGKWSSITDNLTPVEGATFIIAFSDLDKKLVEDNVKTGMKVKWAFQVVLSGIIHQPSVQNVMSKLQEIEEHMHDATPEQLVRAYHE